MSSELTTFDLLTPDVALDAVEAAYGLSLDGTVMSYPSYINRVYGVRTDEGGEYVAKFYRPGRWSWEAIVEEHTFLLECAAAEIPVVSPLGDLDGDSLTEVEVAASSGESSEKSESYPFALFPKRGGRSFDAETDEAWYRLGAVVGRIHGVGLREEAPNRPWCTPEAWTVPFMEELLREELVHPELARRVREWTEEIVARAAPRCSGVPMQRIHGDCHRGNLLDRPGEGLLVIDFDDMMVGPAVQDFWLLLPNRADHCRRELTMLLDGYEEFVPFPRESLDLIEALRYMRMVHFLAWQARQREDHWFRREFPDWGTKQFWIREVEDLETQAEVVRETLG